MHGTNGLGGQPAMGKNTLGTMMGRGGVRSDNKAN